MQKYASVLTIVDLPESTLPMIATRSSAGDTAPGLALSLTTTSAVALSASQSNGDRLCSCLIDANCR